MHYQFSGGDAGRVYWTTMLAKWSPVTGDHCSWGFAQMLHGPGHRFARAAPWSEVAACESSRQRRRRCGIEPMLRVGCAAVLLATVGACTFVEQTQDVLEGGPEKRVEAAEQRQREAIAAQQELQRSQRELEQQLGVEEDKLTALRERLRTQDERIAAAKANQRIAETEERELLTRAAALSGEIQALELMLQAARTTEDTHDREQLQQRLRALEEQAEQMEQELMLLEQ